jgi:hypothetical protein
VCFLFSITSIRYISAAPTLTRQLPPLYNSNSNNIKARLRYHFQLHWQTVSIPFRVLLPLSKTQMQISWKLVEEFNKYPASW